VHAQHRGDAIVVGSALGGGDDLVVPARPVDDDAQELSRDLLATIE
jgi:hypothetical protein